MESSRLGANAFSTLILFPFNSTSYLNQSIIYLQINRNYCFDVAASYFNIVRSMALFDHEVVRRMGTCAQDWLNRKQKREKKLRTNESKLHNQSLTLDICYAKDRCVLRSKNQQNCNKQLTQKQSL